MPDVIRELLQQQRYDEALECLLEQYGDKVFRLAMAILRDAGRAEEVTQDTFVKIWRVLPQYDGRAAPSTWLYTIARNTCLTALRRDAYRRTVPLAEAAEPHVAAHDPARIDWQVCLSRLPDVQRRVITLFYFHDRSVKEVAALLGMPEGTVKNHLHRARKALGVMLE